MGDEFRWLPGKEEFNYFGCGASVVDVDGMISFAYMSSIYTSSADLKISQQ